jgi:hypothetical protein
MSAPAPAPSEPGVYDNLVLTQGRGKPVRRFALFLFCLSVFCCCRLVLCVSVSDHRLQVLVVLVVLVDMSSSDL